MFVEIDGAMGEGGGQVLRTSLAFSLLSGTPVRIVRVRDGRHKPGLRNQHLAALRAAATIGRATITGDAVGSREVTFHPRGVEAGDHVFDIGTAGSATLVFQTVVLPLLLRGTRPSRLVLRGGTHNPMAPPFHFVDAVFLPALRQMGADVRATFTRYGLYPRGGGQLEVTITPSTLAPFTMLERGAWIGHQARFVVAGLRRSIAERERDTYAAAFDEDAPRLETFVEDVGASTGPGNVAMATLTFERGAEVVTTFGERAAPAERVAEDLARAARDFVDGGVPVGEHLADQLILPLVFGAGGTFATRALSLHARTQVDLLSRVASARVRVTNDGDHVVVDV